MWYNFFPQAFVGMYLAVQQGDNHRAMDVQNRFVDFALYGWQFGMRGIFEYIARQRGYAEYVFRQPRAQLTDKVRQQLDQVLPTKIEALESAAEKCLKSVS
jgi:dihydrodipicolinate synthase/N-acetylneuraminate lyase